MVVAFLCLTVAGVLLGCQCGLSHTRLLLSVVAAAPLAGECLNNTHCASDSFCDLTRPTANYVCDRGAVEITQGVKGVCRQTPCTVCRLCLAEWAPFVKSNGTQTDALVVANQLLSQCNLRVGLSNNKNRTVANCNTAFEAVKGSTNGTAGKRAAVICRNLGECVAANLNASCALATASVSPAVPAGVLDYCAPLGTNGSSNEFPTKRVAGIEATIDIDSQSPGGAFCLDRDWHCNGTTGFECRMDMQGPRRVTCDPANGADMTTTLGTCMPTPCTACQSCYKIAASMAVSYKDETNAVTLANAFRTACNGGSNDPGMCSVIGLRIEASFQGSLAKRPIALCRAMGFCNSTTVTDACVLRPNKTATEVVVTGANADACTVDGMPVFEGGSLLAKTDAVLYSPYNGK